MIGVGLAEGSTVQSEVTVTDSEITTTILRQIRDELIATRTELKAEISATRVELKGEISATREELKGELALTNERLSIVETVVRDAAQQIRCWAAT